MSIDNESNKFEGICRYDGAGNPIRLDKGFEKEDTRKKRSFLPIGYSIRKTRSIKSNDYYIKSRRRGGTIAPNIREQFEER